MPIELSHTIYKPANESSLRGVPSKMGVYNLELFRNGSNFMVYTRRIVMVMTILVDMTMTIWGKNIKSLEGHSDCVIECSTSVRASPETLCCVLEQDTLPFD